MPAVTVSGSTANATADRTGPLLDILPDVDVLAQPPAFPFAFAYGNGRFVSDDITYVNTPIYFEAIFRGLTNPVDIGTNPAELGQVVLARIASSYLTTRGMILTNPSFKPLDITEFDKVFKFNEGTDYRVRITITDADTMSVDIWQDGAGGAADKMTLTWEPALPTFDSNYIVEFGFPSDAQINADDSVFANPNTLLATARAILVDIPTPNAGPTAVDLTASNLVSLTIVENTKVGDLVTTHASETRGFNYAKVAGAGDTDNASFTIVGSELRAAGPVAAGAKSIRITTTDIYGFSFTGAVTFTVV